MSLKENHDLVLVTLNADQTAKAKEANGKRKRITHALICGPYGQMFGTENQCMKYYSVWVEIFPFLFSRGVKTDNYEITDFKTTPELVHRLFDAHDPKERLSMEQNYGRQIWNDTYGGLHSFSSLKDYGEAVVLDCETTGLNADTGRVVQIGALKANLDQMSREQKSSGKEYRLEALAITLNPGMPIPTEATKVHGITDADVVNKPYFEDIAESFREWIGSRPIIGHNVQFDVKFLNAEFERVRVPLLNENMTFCTMRRYQEWNDGIWKGSRLDDVARVFDLTGRKTKHHGAMEDTEIALRIALLFYKNDRGLEDSLPIQKPGLPSKPKTSGSKTVVNESEGFMTTAIIVAIVGFVVLAVTCS